MDAYDYQQQAARTECDQSVSKWRVANADDPLLPVRLLHAAVGLIGDAGELASAVEKWIYYGEPLDRLNLKEEIKEEIGDCLWYLAMACNALGLDMRDVMAANLRKLQRRYPHKFEPQRATESGRDRESERKSLYPLTDSYPSYCLHCGKVPVHVSSQSRLCPECAAAKRALERIGEKNA